MASGKEEKKGRKEGEKRTKGSNIKKGKSERKRRYANYFDPKTLLFTPPILGLGPLSSFYSHWPCPLRNKCLLLTSISYSISAKSWLFRSVKSLRPALGAQKYAQTKRSNMAVKGVSKRIYYNRLQLSGLSLNSHRSYPLK